jgi:hypothetical protein
MWFQSCFKPIIARISWRKAMHRKYFCQLKSIYWLPGGLQDPGFDSFIGVFHYDASMDLKNRNAIYLQSAGCEAEGMLRLKA